MDEGYLAFVYGGGEEGKFLCNHSAVESIHLTGSEATYDAIVWGPGKPKVCLLMWWTQQLACTETYTTVRSIHLSGSEATCHCVGPRKFSDMEAQIAYLMHR